MLRIQYHVYPIFITNLVWNEWLNNRVNLSLISMPQSSVILLIRAAMVGIRPNIRTAMAHDTKIVICSMTRLININFLNRLNSLETNPNGLRLFNNSDPLVCTSLSMWSILKTFPRIFDEPQAYCSKIHDTQWVHDFQVGGLYITGKTIIILPQFKIIYYLRNFLMNKGGGSYLWNYPINGDPDILRGL